MIEGKNNLSMSNYDDWGLNPNAPIWIRLAALGIGGILHAVYATSRVEFVQPEFHKKFLTLPGGSYINVFWHKHIGLTTSFFPKRIPRVCLVSRSRDGELLARVMAHLGSRAIRGSSSRGEGQSKGGSSSLRKLARALEAGYHIVITPDGPKGPPERIKPGVLRLAAITGRPILALGMAVSRAFPLSTWDGTLIPLPFTRMALSYSEALYVPRQANLCEIESLRVELEHRLFTANKQAQISLGISAS